MVGAIGNAADSDNAYTSLQRPRPGRLQRQRHRLPALRAARRRVGQPARARRLHVAAVLQHGPGRACRASTSRCSTSSTRATRSPRPPRPQAMRAHRLRPPRARRGRHRLLVGLLPAADRRRRPDAQGPDRADRHPAHPAGRRRRQHRATWSVVSLRARANSMYVTRRQRRRVAADRQPHRHRRLGAVRPDRRSATATSRCARTPTTCIVCADNAGAVAADRQPHRRSARGRRFQLIHNSNGTRQPSVARPTTCTSPRRTRARRR